MSVIENYATMLPIMARSKDETSGRHVVGYVKVADDSFTRDVLKQKTWHFKKKKHGQAYAIHDARSGPRDKRGSRAGMYLHQIVCKHYHGDRPDGMTVDHKDRDTLNNLPDNVRYASKSTQQANQRTKRTNTSGFKGVSRVMNGKMERWCAQIVVNYKHMAKYFPFTDEGKRQAALQVNEWYRYFRPEVSIPNIVM